ncbi:hypothetical protein BSL78_16331 [Apostichopus japonicus]|uniref:Uncharacterized protein n=1 Tax=Stichopus japonicus TaxID=307972 RepID=A0A2G8KFN0_STIJA|nr:hypothetical protein BSL78_16331 [Apostichopus japonicus]
MSSVHQTVILCSYSQHGSFYCYFFFPAKSSTTDSDVPEKKPRAKKVTKKPAKPKKKIAFSDSEEESFQIEEDLRVAPRAERGRRARAPVKYNFGDSGAESQSD